MIELNSSQGGSENEEQIQIFSIDGKEYTIPAKPRVNVALKYLHDAKHKSEDIAAAGLLENLLGEEGYEALMNYEDLTADQLKAIMKIVQKVALGSMEESQGK
jgi:uncharacterized protein YihD (DUF1040 family)